MILSNARVVCGDFKIRSVDVEIQNDRIARIGEDLEGDDVLDLSGKYLLPGFIDTHIHGANGARFDDKEPNIPLITEFEATQGVTALAATVGGSIEGIKRQCDAAYAAHLDPRGAKIVALHSEGPFISVKRKGAMGEQNIIDADSAKLSQIIDGSHGLLKIITLAPEKEGASELIKYAASRGVAVSMGHTDATYEEARDAIEAGVTGMTHTFNAARPINHRDPGSVCAALTSDKIICEVICDFIHLHPSVVKLVYAAKGADRMCMISDSSKVAGLQLDEFEVGGVKRYVKNGCIRLADGTIAGSARTLLDGVRNLVNYGIPIEDVSRMASDTPAKRLGLEAEIGSIQVGKYADMVVMSPGLSVEYTFVNGKCVYRRG